MRSGGSQREMLRVVDREKVEIHVGNDVGGGWRCRRRIDRPVAAAEHRQYEQADEKKTIVKNSIVHKDSLSAATNMPRQRNAIFPDVGAPCAQQHNLDESTSTSFGHLRNLLEGCPVELNAVPSTGSKKGGPEEQRRSRNHIPSAASLLRRAHRCLSTGKTRSIWNSTEIRQQRVRMTVVTQVAIPSRSLSDKRMHPHS